MDAINILWQVGILSAVLIFGIKLGLATGLANMSKRYLALETIGYGGGVLILTEISSFFTQQITDLIYTYNFEFFLIIAAIMILAVYLQYVNTRFLKRILRPQHAWLLLLLVRVVLD